MVSIEAQEGKDQTDHATSMTTQLIGALVRAGRQDDRKLGSQFPRARLLEDIRLKLVRFESANLGLLPQ